MRHKFTFKLTTIFWALVGVFVLTVSNMMLMPMPLIPASLRVYVALLMFISWAALFVLGLALIVLIVKRKVEGLLKKFLLLTGVSAVGFPVFAILHNLVYGLFIYFFGQDFWDRVGLGDEPFFFLLAAIVCPIGFLVGVVGSVVLFVKERKERG